MNTFFKPIKPSIIFFLTIATKKYINLSEKSSKIFALCFQLFAGLAFYEISLQKYLYFFYGSFIND